MGSWFDTKLFAYTIKEKQGGRSLREVALEAGVSIASLSRASRGKMLTDITLVLRICDWLAVPLQSFVRDTSPQQAQEEVTSSLEQVAHMLRMDTSLDSELVEAVIHLLKIIRNKKETQKTRKDFL